MMYFVKQWVGVLATPLVLALLAAAAAAVCRQCKRPKLARWLLASAAAMIYLGASPQIGNALLGPLERKYPSLREDGLSPKIGYIVVLGSGYMPRDGVPITAALDEEGLTRVVEGIRLWHRFGTARLVLSGGAPSGETPAAFGYAALARSLDVNSTSMIILSSPLDTRDEATAVAALIGTTPFILVTSAFHMPRAMRLMERAGAHPIPAPTGQRVDRSKNSARDWLPGSGGLSKTERALHEYIGLAALRMGIG
jgi:uncharacterized SAM-binding protein YcdF (DUF218 family)